MGLRDQNNGKKIGINGSRIYHVTTLHTTLTEGDFPPSSLETVFFCCYKGSVAYSLFAERNPIAIVVHTPVDRIFSLSSYIGNKCAQFVQMYNNDPRSIIAMSF